MTNMYFWHPAYDNCPVVGLTYDQVQAYLNWKEKMMQQELDNKKIKYRVKLSLPSEIEWDIVSTARIKKDTVTKFTYHSEYFWDESWLADLEFLFPNGGMDTISYRSKGNYRNVIKRSWVKAGALLLKDEKSPGHYAPMGFFLTSEANLKLVNNKKEDPQLMLNLDATGISGMGSNVSEWMADTINGSWEVLFRKRQQLLQKSGFPEAKLVSSMEMLYAAHNNIRKKDPGLRLVRGGNWFDERSSFIYGKNAAGMHAKVFVSNSTSRSTIGFRYIIKVYPK
jgi:formylglycine-generating enzyme required for sulfatase activity